MRAYFTLFFCLGVFLLGVNAGYKVVGNENIYVQRAEIFPKTPILGRGLMYLMELEVNPTTVGDSGTFEAWLSYMGVLLPPDQFLNTYFSSMWWVAHDSAVWAHQMMPVPHYLPTQPPLVEAPLAGYEILSWQDELLHFQCRDREVGISVTQEVFNKLRAAVTDLPVCDAAVLVGTVSHVLTAMPRPLTVAIVGGDTMSAVFADAVAVVADALNVKLTLLIESPLTPHADKALTEVISAHPDIIWKVSKTFAELYEERLLLGAVFLSHTRFDISAQIYKAVRWLVHSGMVVTFDRDNVKHLPLEWRPYFEVFGRDSYKQRQVGMYITAFERTPQYPFDGESSTGLQLHLDIYSATHTRAGSIVMDVPFEASNSTLQKQFDHSIRQAVIVVPCFNCRSTIAPTLDSVLQSALVSTTMLDKVAVTVVVVDDRSTDDSVYVVQKYIRDTKEFIDAQPVTVMSVVAAENKGPGASRNLGVRAVPTADVIFFCDADDRFYPQHVTYGIQTLESNPDLGFVRAQVDTKSYGDVDPFWRIALSNTLPLAHVIRRECWDLFGGFPEDRLWFKREDVWFARVIFAFCSGAHMRELSVEYVRREGNVGDFQKDKFQNGLQEWLEDDKASAISLPLDPILHHVQRLWGVAEPRGLAWHSVRQITAMEAGATVLSTKQRSLHLEDSIRLGKS